MALNVLLKLSTIVATAIAAGIPYEEYILAPSSRTLHPVSVHTVNGSVSNPQSLLGQSLGNATFSGPSAVTYDFGKNIAGLVSLQIGKADGPQVIGLTYTESSLWISGIGCDATGNSGLDAPLLIHASKPGNYTVARKHERGGFRYLSLVHNSTGNIQVDQITVQYTPMPHYADDALRNYTGYFHSDDELLNRIWYAGAYTSQMCTIDPHHGDALADSPTDNPNLFNWWLNGTLSNGSSVLTDGAKRDRLVWPGDMSISQPTIAMSTYDLISVTNGLDALFSEQNKTTGELPYAGSPFPFTYSATYHMYSLIGVADYYLYSNDLPYLQNKWDQWKLGLNFSLSFIDKSGLMNVTSSADWLRYGMGGHNIEANSILYYTINKGIFLGTALNEDKSLLSTWARKAAGVKTAANRLLWNETAGLYRDNQTTSLMPQDGNSWSVLANITDSQVKSQRVSAGLAARWTAYGAPSPEAGNAISPFIGGFELQTHVLAGNASAALDLMRLEWGYMLNYPLMTNSTFIEGYYYNGDLHYPAYADDARISHAHGWSTGPTSVLTSYIGGIHILTAGGRTWSITPMLGDLKTVDTGFKTSLGSFDVQVQCDSSGKATKMKFTTPSGTKGTVKVPGAPRGYLKSTTGKQVALQSGVANNVAGGTYQLVIQK